MFHVLLFLQKIDWALIPKFQGNQGCQKDFK